MCPIRLVRSMSVLAVVAATAVIVGARLCRTADGGAAGRQDRGAGK
jgi:hypothetical protein